MTAHTTPVRFEVMRVNCRFCSAEIPIEISDGLAPDEQLAECERQAEAKHDCEKRRAAAAAQETTT